MGICSLLRIPPWDLDRLTVDQLVSAARFVDQTNKENSKTS